MKRDKKRKTLQETLSSVDGVLAALNAYPSLEDAILEKAQEEMNKYLGKFFPTQLDFSKEVLEHLVGTDVMIDIISGFLTVALPGVEVSLKAALLANMQNLGTNCTIDPFIYEKAIKEGVVFDLKQIDLIDKLTISPLDEKFGKYYYFGIEDCESAYDVLKSAIDPNNQTEERRGNWADRQQKREAEGKRVAKRYDSETKQKEGTSYLNRAFSDSVGHYFGARKRDFDCLLWYMKNKASYREVWGKRTSASEDIFNGGGTIEEWLKKKGHKKSYYYHIDDKGTMKYYDGKGKEVGGSPTLKEMVTDQAYFFMDGKGKFVYRFGKPVIKKINSDKVYFTCDNKVENGNINVVIYKSSSDHKWKSETYVLKKYNAIDEITLEDGVKKGDFIFVGDSLFVVSDDVKTKNKKVPDSHQEVIEGKTVTVFSENKTKEITVISKIKTKECINITNDLTNNTYVFVDYDEKEGNKTKGELIKDGFEVQSSLSNENVGQRQWFKEKYVEKTDDMVDTLNGNINGITNALYYIKKSSGNFDINVDKILIPPYRSDKGVAKSLICLNDKMEKDNKYTKDFGVLTLDFSPRSGNVLQSDGDPMQQQTPYDNVLHVFFGNVKEIPTSERNAMMKSWEASSDVNRFGKLTYKIMKSLIKINSEFWNEYIQLKKKEKLTSLYYGTTEYDVNTLFEWTDYKFACLFEGTANDDTVSQEIKPMLDPNNVEMYENRNGVLMTKIKKIYSIIYEIRENVYRKNGFDFVLCKQRLSDLETELDGYSVMAYVNRASQIMDANENLLYLSAKNVKYPEAKKNYYYKRTLFEFNIDYVNSLQLFDAKVLAAQLITSLFGGATISAMIGATASWKTELIHDIIKDLVEKEIASEDMAISDCFFTFTNDSFNGMLRATELRQAGLYSKHGEQNGNNKVDPLKLLEGLNGIDDAADQAGQTDIIKGAITNAAVEVSKDVYTEDNHLSINSNFGIKMSFIETLMINLCTQCVMAMLSPKVYLLILINLQMFGMSTDFDIKAFLERFANLIRSIVKSVVDQFMQYIIEKIMKILEELLQKLIIKINFEQVEMYARLLKQILMHLRMLLGKFKTPNMGWTQDVVGYADIVSTDTQEPINEC